MDTGHSDATCIIDRDGVIVWASPGFVDLFAHRVSPAGLTLGELFAGYADGGRSVALPWSGNAMLLEDRDREGRRRFFRAERHRVDGPDGGRVSEVVVLRDATLERTLDEIARLATQARSPKELLEKALAIVRDTRGYLGVAGFVARDGRLELTASKGWTERLKSMIRTVPVAPDAPAMAGRCAYHRKQMVVTIGEYRLMPAVKEAIERIHGRFVAVTPLLDHDRLAGVLAVIHGEALPPGELETLGAVCGRLAIALAVRLREEDLSGRAEAAALFTDLLADAIARHRPIMEAWAADPGGKRAREMALRAMEIDRETSHDVEIARAGGSEKGPEVPLADAIARAIRDAGLTAARDGKKLEVSQKLKATDARAKPLLRYALRNVLDHCVGRAEAPSVKVEVRTSLDRTGARRIEVADRGPGVPDEVKSAVFRRAGRPGTGGGMCLARRIVGRYGGRIWVEDRVPGSPAKGARVVIVLPAAAPSS